MIFYKLLKIFSKVILFPFIFLDRLRWLSEWYFFKKCSPPAPHFIKQSLLLRHGINNSVWVETGTYLGQTTKFLSEHFSFVHSIEPSNKCLRIAKRNLRFSKNVALYDGTSELCFEEICSSLSGDICFWLDGHYSEGITFKGATDTPILFELDTIKKYLENFSNTVILIDDIRTSHIDKDNYPPLSFYVNWADSVGMDWIIELDSFIIKSKGLPFYR